MFSKYVNDLNKEFKGYNLNTFQKDLFAGITVCAVALPLALAFGVSSGADAAAGLITAIIAGIVISILSGASFQISGPTGAMSAILLPLALKFQLQGIFIVCFIAGIILVILSLLKMGRIVNCIPAPVITGFTSGIAIIIALGQIDNMFGVKAMGETQIERIASYFVNGFSPNWSSVLIGLIVVVFMVVYPKKINEKFPSSLAAIILAVIINLVFKLPVSTIGQIPKTLILNNRFDIFAIDLSILPQFIAPAVSVAALALVESLLCGTCGSKIKGDEKLDPDRELLAQGIGNMIMPFFGGVPATAAIARTSVAIKSGGQTRITGIVHSFGLIASMFLLGGIMSSIPLSALAGVLIVTAWRMNEWNEIKFIFSKKYKGAMSKFLITMTATVVFDLTLAIIIGIVAAILLFTFKIAQLNIRKEEIEIINGKKGVVLYLTGPVFFLTSNKLKKLLDTIKNEKVIVFSMSGVPLIDVTAVQELISFCKEVKGDDVHIIFEHVQNSVRDMLERSEIHDLLGYNPVLRTANKRFGKARMKVRLGME